MKTTVICTALAALAILPSKADVKVNIAGNPDLKEVKVTHALLSDMQKPGDFKIDEKVYPVKNGQFTITLDQAGPARYSIDFSENERADFYASPVDNLLVDISSLSPLTYSVTGSELMDGITVIDSQTEPIYAEFLKERQSPNPDTAKLEEIGKRFDSVLIDFIDTNPNSTAAVYALMQLDGENYIKEFGRLGDGARRSILYPFAQQRLEAAKAQMAKERLQKEMAAGNVDAPDFTLLDPSGRKVSLADFRGKWVIIDFWGSWCVWCIKGFPHLKEVYEANKDRLEVVGVACQDSDKAWRAAIEKYSLPWVNLFNPKDGGDPESVTQKYGVQGFPTKVIVNPQGKVVNITTGDDPEFYNVLEKFMK